MLERIKIVGEKLNFNLIEGDKILMLTKYNGDINDSKSDLYTYKGKNEDGRYVLTSHREYPTVVDIEWFDNSTRESYIWYED